jgi:multicomponent Na+:H+ antiporter subunit G
MISRTIICSAFVLLTSPVGAHALARGSYKGGVRLWPDSVCDEYAKAAGPSDDAAEETTGAEPASAE